MNKTISWACYLWLLTIDSLEELIDFVSNFNLIARRVKRVSGYGWSENDESQLPIALGGR
jgi:hypothetical protein